MSYLIIPNIDPKERHEVKEVIKSKNEEVVQNNEEERRDMFDWMARERFHEVHTKREYEINDYITREPLKPQILHSIPPANESESRKLLRTSHFVQIMKAKWEAMTMVKNPPPLNLMKPPHGVEVINKLQQPFYDPIPMSQKMFQNSLKNEGKVKSNKDQIFVRNEESLQNQPSCKTIEECAEDRSHPEHLIPESNKIYKLVEKVEEYSFIQPKIKKLESQIDRKPKVVEVEVQTTPRLNQNGCEKIEYIISSKCNVHVLPDLERLDKDFQQKAEFQSTLVTKREHEQTDFKLSKTFQKISSGSVQSQFSQSRELIEEDLLPNSIHPPVLPDPIKDEDEDNEHGSAKDKPTSWFSNWIWTNETKSESSKSSINKKESSQHSNIYSEHSKVVLQNLENSYISDESSSKSSLSESSTALEIEGYPIRRATITTEEYLLMDLSADYDETVLEENDPKVLSVHKSQSEINQTNEELQFIAKSRSEEFIRNSKGALRLEEHQHSFDRKYHLCHKCKKIIRHGDATFQHQSGHQTIWHMQCFACTVCHKQLGLMDHLMFEEEPYCYEHYVLVAHVSKCHGCKEYIFDSSFTSAAGYYWHRDHFICHSCEKPLVDAKYVNVHGRVYCFNCHEINFSKVCNFCQNTIKPYEPYVQSGEFYWHSNDNCLHCQTCGRSLVGGSLFFRKGGSIYCNRYCSIGRVV